MSVQGTVSKIFAKVVKGGKEVFSFRLDNDENYYRTGFNKPPFNEGDEVRFDFSEDQYGKQVNMGSIQSRQGTAKPQATQAPKAGGYKKQAGGGARDDYWAEKDRYDKEVRQPLISFQAATNVAKDLAIAALDNGILPTAGSKKTDKFDSFMDIVKEIRKDIYGEYHAVTKTLESGKSIVAEAPPEEAPAIEKAATPEAAGEAPVADSWDSMEDSNDEVWK